MADVEVLIPYMTMHACKIDRNDWANFNINILVKYSTNNCQLLEGLHHHSVMDSDTLPIRCHRIIIFRSSYYFYCSSIVITLHCNYESSHYGLPLFQLCINKMFYILSVTTVVHGLCLFCCFIKSLQYIVVIGMHNVIYCIIIH